MSKVRALPTTWERGLITNDGGLPKRGIANVMHVLAVHPAWIDAVAYDEFHGCVVKLKPPPSRAQDGHSAEGEWTEADSTRTATWFASDVGFEPAIAHVDQAVAAIAERNKVHPVRNYLHSLEWDGQHRLDRMLHTHFGATDTEYTRAIGARWMISAVARAERPGCQADCMLVLESELQGIGKSTGFEALAGKDWFADTGISVGDKDSYQALRGKWIYEFGELDSLKGREATRVKGFVSARSDTYRPSYGRRTRDFPRQVVFCGTTNETEYLIDRTGNRRFWPVRCVGGIDVDGIHRDRDQLWAEARARFLRGDKWHVDTPELRRLCEEAQQEREVEDPWLPLVARWLDQLNPQVRERGVTTDQVLDDVLKVPRDRQRHDLVTRVGHVLRACGWEPKQLRREGGRVRLYYPSQASRIQLELCRDSEPCETSSNPQPSQASHPCLFAHVEGERAGAGDFQCETDKTRDGRDAVTPSSVDRMESEAIAAEGRAE